MKIRELGIEIPVLNGQILSYDARQPVWLARVLWSRARVRKLLALCNHRYQMFVLHLWWVICLDLEGGGVVPPVNLKMIQLPKKTNEDIIPPPSGKQNYPSDPHWEKNINPHMCGNLIKTLQRNVKIVILGLEHSLF